MHLHELTQSMRQKDMKYRIYCLNNKYVQTVPHEGSEEDRMLQSHELKLNPNHENYPHDAMHVYAQNVHCDAWNETDSNCFLEENTQIQQQTVKKMTALNLQMLHAYQSM